MGRCQLGVRALLLFGWPPWGISTSGPQIITSGRQSSHCTSNLQTVFSTRKIIFLLLSYFKITFRIYISPKTHPKPLATQDTAKGESQLKSGPDCSFQMSRKTHHGLCLTNTLFFFLVLVSGQILTVTQAGLSNSWEFSCLTPESWKSWDYRHACTLH